MRTNFEMTAEDLGALLAAMQPVPMIALQCGTPRSVQENTNAAWAVLGKKLGFDPTTVRPNGYGDRHFSADAVAPEEKPHLRRDGNAWCATGPGFVDLQQSPAGFGDTPEEALENLLRAERAERTAQPADLSGNA